MKKKDLIIKIHENTGVEKSKVKLVVEDIFQVIAQEISENKKVEIIGFGTFLSIFKEAAIKRNPLTGKDINVPAKLVPKFKPGKSLKDHLIMKTPKK